MKPKKALKLFLSLVIAIIILTHRHEDYCTRHPHRLTGQKDQPLPFGPWNQQYPVSEIDSSQAILPIE